MLINDQVMESNKRSLAFDTFAPVQVVTVYPAISPYEFTNNLPRLFKLPQEFANNVPPGVSMQQYTDARGFSDFLGKIGKGTVLSGMFLATVYMNTSETWDVYLRYNIEYRKSHSD